MSRMPRRRPAILTALVLLFALEAVTTVAVHAAEIVDARATTTVVPPAAAPAAVAPALLALGPAAGARVGAGPAPADLQLHSPTSSPGSGGRRAVVRPAVATLRIASDPRGHLAAAARRRPAARPHPTPARGTAPTDRRGSYHGRNHVWSATLGIDRAVYGFACSRASKPGDVVYRWGCAGHDNVYLLGHAASVFGGLERAYYDGRLRAGVRVYYADGSGIVHGYAVAWWKVVRPTPDAAWAWASLPRPSMTLQTCLGAHSGYRLMVRLTRIS